ncbi:MAG: hypothetical protein QGG42_06235 [Phycisphaerae bacterium]|jgi:hypothetical protein|nr:hypothetical protein [Phycisphaerae bacterium]
MNKKLLLTFVACGFVLLAGCVDKEPPNLKVNGEPAVSQTAPTHVITVDTVYYMDGPQQSRPPEGTFKSGTKVTLVRNAGSYSVVRSTDGVQAYVATGALKAVEK